MRRLLVLSLFLVLALPCAAQAALVQARIVGGTQVSAGDYPWQVAVNGTAGDCGGTLIAPRYVLTAEHCQVQAGDEVRANSLAWSSGGQVLGVDEVIRHPQAFAGGTNDADPPVWFSPRYDANILRLDAPVTNARPLALVGIDEPQLWAAGTVLTITGWGRISDGGALPEDMRQAQVPVVADADCATAYDEFSSDDMFCAGLPEGGVDTCQGDSGGPIISPTVASPSKTTPADWRLVGITSWGYGCAEPGYPGVYARLGVAALGDWVRAVLAAAPAETVTDPVAKTDPDPDVVDEVVAAPTGDILTPPEEPVPAAAPVEVPVATPAVSLAVKRRCTRKRRCTFTITPRGDVAKVRVSLSTTTKRTCRRRGKRTTCRKTTTRTLKTLRRVGRFTTRTATVSKGAHTLTVTPLDAAGKRAGTSKRYRFSVR